MSEDEKMIKGWGGLYTVTSKGEVFSYHTGERKILSPRYNPSRNRVDVRLVMDNYSETRDVHRLVADAFLPNPNNLKHLLFKDGNPRNVDISNLEWKGSKMGTLPVGCHWLEGWEGLYYVDKSYNLYNRYGRWMKPTEDGKGHSYTLYRQGKYIKVMKSSLETLANLDNH